MSALWVLSGLLLPILAWWFVARKVLYLSIKRGHHKAIGWIAGLALGFLAAVCVLLGVAGLETGGDKGHEMLLSAASMLAFFALLFWLTTKKPLVKDSASVNLWDKVKQHALHVWRTAEEDVKRKSDAKAKSHSAEYSMAMFSYVDVEGEWTERTVTDLSAYSDGSRQYIQGYCLDRGDIRTFRVDRIRGNVSVNPGGKQLRPGDFFRKLPYPSRNR